MRSFHKLIGLTLIGLCSGCSQDTTDQVPASDKSLATEAPPPPRDIAGISICQPANLPECEKEKTYGMVSYKTFPSNVPCWSYTLSDRGKISLAKNPEMPKDGLLQASLGSKNVPDGVYDMAEITVIKGRIEEIKLTTFGQSHQSNILRLLKDKWGEPTINNMQHLQNGFGAKFQGVEAQWLFSDFTVAFFGILTKPDDGLIAVRSPVAAAKEKEQSQGRAKSF